MRGLLNIFKSAAVVLGAGPQAICRVDGFELSMEQKQGVLLKATPKEGGDSKPASEDSYYEITIRPNGENPEYPAQEKASTYAYTIGLKDTGLGFSGGVGFAPAGAQFKKFELVEEFDDGRYTMGHRMPPHHTVMLRAHFQDAKGESSSMALGAWVRKSETESPAWKAAQQSRVMWI